MYGLGAVTGFAVPAELANNLFVEHGLLIDHATHCVGKTSRFHTIHSDLGHCYLAFKRLRSGFPIDVAGQAVQLPGVFGHADSWVDVGFGSQLIQFGIDSDYQCCCNCKKSSSFKYRLSNTLSDDG